MRRKLFALATAAALILTGFTRGQDTPDTGKQTEPAKTEKTDKAKSAAKKLALEDVRQMLENMGYEPKAIKNKDGKVTGYYVMVAVGDAKVECQFSLSGDQSNIWVNCFLLKFNDKFPIGADVLQMFLENQDGLWPAYVQYYSDTQTVWLCFAIPNQDVGTATLRREIEGINKRVQLLVEGLRKVLTAREKAKDEAQAKKKDEGKKDPLP